jgi:hypothetical protein
MRAEPAVRAQIRDVDAVGSDPIAHIVDHAIVTVRKERGMAADYANPWSWSIKLQLPVSTPILVSSL